MGLYGAIEAGGTKFVCAVADEDLKIIDKVSILTTVPEETMSRVLNFFANYQLQSIGVGSFGPIDINKKSESYGFITNTPKAGWSNYNFVGTIEEALEIPVSWDTDVNVAAYGEYNLGAARTDDSCLYLTVGTGIGGGAVYNGEILEGNSHPEMGHLLIRRYEDDGFSGVCPFHDDCLEGMASGKAIELRFGKKGSELDVDDPFWNAEANYLAQALVTYSLVLSPAKIILGGGVMKTPMLLDKIHEQFHHLQANYLNLPSLESYIVTPELGDEAGIMGCLLLAKENFELQRKALI